LRHISMSKNLQQKILQVIDRETAYTVQELAEMFDVHWKEIRSALEGLMERGEITSPPDWKYRRSR